MLYSDVWFHAVKNLTTAEGGAVTWIDRPGLDNEEVYHQFMLLSLHGQSKDALSKMKLGSWEYDVVSPSYKCNMTDLTAAFGLAQLSRFEAMSNTRKQIFKRYLEKLMTLGVDCLQHENDDKQGNYHLLMVRVPDMDEKRRNRIIVKMAEAGIACNVHFKPLPLLTAYRKMGFRIEDYPNAYTQYHNEITLPSHTQLCNEDIDYIIKTLKTILDGKRTKQILRNNIVTERVWENDEEGILKVQRIIKECGEEMFLQFGFLHWATQLPLSLIREECINKEVYLFKDKSKGQYIATCNVSDKPSLYFDTDKKALYLQRVAVSPELWHKGIGESIFDLVSEKAKKLGCTCIRSTVYADSTLAVGYLTKMGYKTLYKRPSKNFVLLCMESEIK